MFIGSLKCTHSLWRSKCEVVSLADTMHCKDIHKKYTRWKGGFLRGGEGAGQSPGGYSRVRGPGNPSPLPLHIYVTVGPRSVTVLLISRSSTERLYINLLLSSDTPPWQRCASQGEIGFSTTKMSSDYTVKKGVKKIRKGC
jgi:hypothetical protein